MEMTSGTFSRDAAKGRAAMQSSIYISGARKTRTRGKLNCQLRLGEIAVAGGIAVPRMPMVYRGKVILNDAGL